MRNLNKGLWVVVLSLGVLVTPGLILNSLSLSDTKDPQDVPSKEKDPSKKKQKVLEVTCDFDPNKLNLKSKGKYVTVYIEITKGYDVYEIIPEEILLNDFLHIESKPITIADNNLNSIPDLMVKFNRSRVINFLLEIEPIQFWEVSITGKLIDGVGFKATTLVELLHF
ncbi:MAG: hypothetical protein ACFE9Q_00675 [Candidatus Hodarchaeota archaeon]